MDNKSRRSSLMDPSVYLSFDAESTIAGQTYYRTLESDISAISNISKIEDACEKTEEKHGNSTLENQNSSVEASPLKTVKKMDAMSVNSPLRVLPKNIMREYKALCSTPSKEQLLKTVDVTRGSDACRYDDLGVAFLGVDDGLPAFFPPPPPPTQSVVQRQHQRCEENKENISDGSTLSVSSSVEIATSVIERKCLSSVSHAGLMVVEDDSLKVERKADEIVKDPIVDNDAMKTPIAYDRSKVVVEDQHCELFSQTSPNEDVTSLKMDSKTVTQGHSAQYTKHQGSNNDEFETNMKSTDEVINEILFVIEETPQTLSEVQNAIAMSLAKHIEDKSFSDNTEFKKEMIPPSIHIPQIANEISSNMEPVMEVVEEETTQQDLDTRSEKNSKIEPLPNKLDESKTAIKETYLKMKDIKETVATAKPDEKDIPQIAIELSSNMEPVMEVEEGTPQQDLATRREENKNPESLSLKLKESNTVKGANAKTEESKILKETIAAHKPEEKPKIPVLKPLSRRSVCLPNLQTNKPSRILSSKGPKRQSMLPSSTTTTRKQQALPMDIETEIPLLMSKMLKISDTYVKEEKTDKANAKPESEQTTKPASSKPIEKRRSAVPMASSKGGRSSLLPSALGEKRPFSFTQRMSVVVKTTLNSPARKMARKSTIASTSTHLQQQHQRRSMMATRKSEVKIDTGVRKSMLPTNKIGTSNNIRTGSRLLATVKETPPTSQKKADVVAKAQIQSSAGETTCMLKIQDNTVLSCPSCKEKFRIKSLLDAHRRSHEGGDSAPPPPVAKKPTSSLQTVKPPAAAASQQPHSLLDNSNKCKYCDKQFALVRALHQHLMLHCSKIPPGEKKKLQYTELDHVEKARLPNVFNRGHGNGHNSANSVQATPRLPANKTNAASSTTATAQKALYTAKKPTDSSGERELNNKSSESISSISAGSNSNVNNNTTSSTSSSSMGSIQKPKKATAHSGVYRTPSKTVPCHICKLTFKSILDYTNHSLATHGQKSQNSNDEVSHEN
ncbi:uncharacterized protein isoform X2 [Musca autumnalis]|uniref:uncharacterized protein isoform X2 n=1 Tax=Musca autumnalis TaxID=221902 RepID=UPI003CE81669